MHHMHRVAALFLKLLAAVADFGISVLLVAAFFVGMTQVGGWLGWELATIPNLQVFKVLNVLGMALDIAGVVFLSRMVSRSSRLQEFVGNWLPFPLVLAALDIAVGVQFEMTEILTQPSGQAVRLMANIALPALALLMLVVLLGGGFAPFRQYILKKLNRPEGPAEVRAGIVGGATLLSGLAIQLVAAVMDLYS